MQIITLALQIAREIGLDINTRFMGIQLQYGGTTDNCQFASLHELMFEDPEESKLVRS